uniref:Uncharacterized protein n=1 Tax=Plectus sambesii TaxID=2011161 RepID=A0A914XQ15_9BILA
MVSAPNERRSNTSEARTVEQDTTAGSKIGDFGRFDLRTYVCGTRMRIFSAFKSLLSIVYAVLLIIMITNFKVVDEELDTMDQRTTKLPWDSTFAEVEAYEAVRLAERDGRGKYKRALWTALALCLFHIVASGVTVLCGFLSGIHALFGHLAHLAWWLMFVMTILIPTVTSIFYFVLLPRTVDDTFGQLIRTAERDYNAIKPLEVNFNCCSVDYLPDINSPETTKRFKPVNANNSCTSTSEPAFATLNFPHWRNDSWLVVKTTVLQQESCTKRLLSYFPGRTRWLWILIAASVPHTAFGWLLLFDLMFICLVWYERGAHPVPLSEQLSKELIENGELFRRFHESNEPDDILLQSRRYTLDQKTLSKYYVRVNSTSRIGSRMNTPPASRKPTQTTIRSYGISTPPASRKSTIIRLNSEIMTNRERDSLGEATTTLLQEAKAQIVENSFLTQNLSEPEISNRSTEWYHRKNGTRQRARTHELSNNYQRSKSKTTESNFGEVRVIISEHEEEEEEEEEREKESGSDQPDIQSC